MKRYNKKFATHEDCLNYYRNYREKNREAMRLYNRYYNKKYRKIHGYYNERNSELRYPEKQKARKKLRYELSTKRIKKLPCLVCGSIKSQAHHNDYSKPLDVKWFCALHHTEYEKNKLSCGKLINSMANNIEK